MKDIKSAFLQTYDISNWNDPFAVTLTARRVPRDFDGRGLRVYASDIDHRQNFRHFMNVLNRKSYGRAFTQHGKRVAVIPVLEQQQSGRYHYHAALERPIHLGRDTFEQLIREAWTKTRLGNHNIRIVMGADNGWISYMSKARSKASLADAIDWENLHNVDR